MSGEINAVDVPCTPERERTTSESSEPEIRFSPILPEVEISTNEENEVEFFKIRAKLYRFDSLSDPPEWKERGTGELKLLKHKQNSSFRLVMRRDKTLKVCANHFLTPVQELKSSVGNDKAFIYTVLADFADETPKAQCLAVKFANVDNATLFKTKFEEAQKILLTDCDLYNGKGDEENAQDLSKSDEEDSGTEDDENKITSEVIEKLSELNVSKDENSTK